eukprot:5812058-Amphidinium_carterae.1
MRDNTCDPWGRKTQPGDFGRENAPRVVYPSQDLTDLCQLLDDNSVAVLNSLVTVPEATKSFANLEIKDCTEMSEIHII